MKNIFYLVGIIAILFSCNTNSTPVSDNTDIVNTKLGGEITIPLDSYFAIEKPTEVLKVESAQIYGQMFESLVKYDSKTIEVVPSLAEKWDLSEDGITYTFHLRKGVMFQDNPCFEGGKGREVTTQDVLDMFYRVYERYPKILDILFSKIVLQVEMTIIMVVLLKFLDYLQQMKLLV